MSHPISKWDPPCPLLRLAGGCWERSGEQQGLGWEMGQHHPAQGLERGTQEMPLAFPNRHVPTSRAALWASGSGPVAIPLQMQAGSLAPAAPRHRDHPFGSRGGIKH